MPENVITDSSNNVKKKGHGSDGAVDVKMVQTFMDQGKAARAPFDSDWKNRMDLYRDANVTGKKSAKVPANKAAPILNIIRQTIQSVLPLLTDASPGFNVMGSDPTDSDFAEILNDAVESWWQKYSMDHTMIEVLMDQSIYDAGIFKVTWDQDLEEGAGDIHAEVIDPNDIFVNPGASDFIKGCNWVIHRTRKTVGDLKIQFPKFADRITPEDDPKNKNNKEDMSGSMDVTLVSPTDQDVGVSNTPSVQGVDLRKTAEVWECWMTDDEVEEYFEEQDDGTKEKKFKKKWPRGKLITILPNKKLRLQVVENPYKHGRFPFVRFVDALLPRQFWGEGEVRSLEGLQAIINKLLGNVLDYSNIMANPVWITEDGNGVNANRLTNATGLIIRTRAGKLNTIKREIAPAMQSGAIDLLSWMLRQVEMVSGSADVSQGRRPTGITAAAAIESLQEAAQTRIRLKERNMNVSLGQMGYLVSALMMQYYKTPRVVRMTGQDGNKWPDYFDFFVEELPEGMRGTKRQYRYDPQQGYVLMNTSQTKPTKGVFDVKVASGTNLPFQKAQRSNVAFKLFELGAIDQEELLKSLDWPNQEQVLKRTQEQQQQQQAMQAQAPQGGK